MAEPATKVLAADLREIGGQHLWCTEHNERDTTAIVALHVPHQVDTRTKLLASVKEEELTQKPHRVLRRYKPFEEALGCNFLLETIHYNNDKTVRARDVLIEMQPGAAFVVQRSGELEGAPALLTIRWNGRWNMRGMSHPTDAIDESRFQMFVFGEHKKRRHHSAAATMPSFHAR
jgi:hypothetical protein